MTRRPHAARRTGAAARLRAAKLGAAKLGAARLGATSRLAPLLALALASCGSDAGDTGPPPTPGNYIGTTNAGSSGLFGEGGISFGTAGKNGEGGGGQPSLGVNAFLWRGALDTLSFMPLASADPFGGVIITDYYEPPSSPGERFKATAYILGRELRSDGLRVSIFRQVRGPGGQWQDAQVSPQTVGDIENKMLARARELRAQQASQ
jgi:hypothetical protein